MVAAIVRFTRIGYAEFHEDELENMRLIVRAYKGEEFVPFIDSKGPIHWLLPAAGQPLQQDLPLTHTHRLTHGYSHTG